MNRKAITAVDVGILVLICLFAVVALVIPVFADSGSTVVIRVGDQEVMRLSLHQNGEQTVETEYGYNTVTVQNGVCFVSDFDCRDGICNKRGKISRRGESIVCLPHRLIVEIE